MKSKLLPMERKNMTGNPDSKKILTDRHTELLDELKLTRKTIDQLMKKTSPQLLEVLKSESLFVLRDMEEHISCEKEEALKDLEHPLPDNSRLIYL